MENKQYSIGVVTYHARFETYFKPLITQLAQIFPDKEIVCIINGHPDRTLQIKYLKKVVSFLKTFPNVRYLTYDLHQSLAKCWNQQIILSPTNKILLLNDDTQVSELFRTELEKNLQTADFFTLNKSWSHLVISKSTIKKFGWFDERFLGIGHEDGDYGYRMALEGVEIVNIDCAGLRNFVATQEKPGWSDFSANSSGNRYADINREFFNKKWLTPWNSPETSNFTNVCKFNESPSPFTPIAGMETPMFYEFSVLDEVEIYKAKSFYSTPLLLVKVQKIYFTIGRAVARLLRNLKK